VELKENTNIFENIMQIAELKGIKNPSDLAIRMGYTNPEKLYRLSRKPDAKPSADILQDFSNLFEDANMNFILTGRGEKLKSVDYYNYDSNLSHINEPLEEYKGVPVFKSPATASAVEVYDDTINEGPAFYVTIPQFKDCKFGKVIYGHSMYPTITSGSYVFCKDVADKMKFTPGEIYYVEYDNFGVCKRLQKGASKGEVLLVSDNDELRSDETRRYESFTLNIDDIRNLYLVKGWFTQNHN
jgi:hypothetical protein